MRLLTRLICLATLFFSISVQAAEIRGLDGKCLDAAGESSENGTHLILWECTGHENQNWYFNEKGELRGINNKCVDAEGNSSKNGTQLVLWDCNGGSNQQWNFSSDGQIQGMGNKCFDMTGNVSDNGTKITLWKCHGKGNQHWRAVSNDNNRESSGNQREKKRWYHGDDTQINRPSQRQNSVPDDSRHDRGDRYWQESNPAPAYPNNDRWDQSKEYPSNNRWDQPKEYPSNTGNNRWQNPNNNLKNEAICQNLYDVHNKCYAVGVISKGSPAKKAKKCDHVVDKTLKEMEQSTDSINFNFYSRAVTAVCTNACKEGIDASGVPAYEEFRNICSANGL